MPAASRVLGTPLAGLFGLPGIVMRETWLGQDEESPHVEEAAIVAGCSHQRRREFAAGRRCAREALAELAIADFPILAGSDRAPIWPDAVVGSITHTEVGDGGYCAAALAPRRQAAGLGIDAEPRQPLSVELWPRALDAEERCAVTEAVEPGIHARLLFSAKEATYKATYPAFGRFLDFSDVHIQLLARPGCFLAELTGAARAILPSGRLVGRFVMDDDLIVTGVLLPATASPLAQEGLCLHHVPC
jgi:4'-phosphopantetheinyl transferase EntD